MMCASAATFGTAGGLGDLSLPPLSIGPQYVIPGLELEIGDSAFPSNSAKGAFGRQIVAQYLNDPTLKQEVPFASAKDPSRVIGILDILTDSGIYEVKNEKGNCSGL